MRSWLLVFGLLSAVACDAQDPLLPPVFDGSSALPDLGVFDQGTPPDGGTEGDAGTLDSGTSDTGLSDSGAPDAADGGVTDTGAGDSGQQDVGPGDAGRDAGSDAGDTSVVDSGRPDAGPVDTGPRDLGMVLTDGDGDGIADIDEGDGLVDSDGDGMPDTVDLDSDNDGILDADEAGDSDLNTPPRDTDNDGIPDFRDDDSDGDGLLDALEGQGDPDGDGRPNYLDEDSDGDLIRDIEEGAADLDGDLQPNFLDLDSDGDSISDRDEAGDATLVSPAVDSDFDGTADFLDFDSDNDFIADAEEGTRDSDNDGVPNRIDIDSDNDAVLDLFEAGDMSLVTPAVDTDADGVPDYEDIDSDGDSISDQHEGRRNSDNDAAEDRVDLDSDNDGVPDSVEAGDNNILTFPIDTDFDLIPDYRDLDSDGDGLGDSIETGCPGASERTLSDSDADGFDDLAEIGFGSDPCNRNAGITDFYFVLPPGGPLQNAPLAFTDTAIDRADIAINIDTTASMIQELNNLKQSLSTTIIPGIDRVVPDAAFSVSSFEDVPVAPFGDPNDVPWALATRVTTDATVAQTAINVLNTGDGADRPEAGFEALYQISTGAGMTFPGGSIAPFDPNRGLVPGVADGSIGGVGFRQDSLPIIFHVTDQISHTDVDYSQSAGSIAAADVASTMSEMLNIGARVVSASGGVPPINDVLCAGNSPEFYGAISNQDVDWYELGGVQAGDTLDIVATAQSLESTLDVAIAVYNANGMLFSVDNSGGTLGTDARMAVFLGGTAPFYLAVGASGDADFDGIGGNSIGFYAIDLTVRNAGRLSPTPSGCRLDDGDDRATATPTAFAPALAPDPLACTVQCAAALGVYSPLFQDLTYPIELPEATRAVVPPCSWDEFGPSRPTGCLSNQCCTGPDGIGVAPNANGQCPLAFQMDSVGTGLDQALVTGVEALVNFASFRITSVVRPDPIELAASGLDTSCFIHGVIPATATPPNTCAPLPVAVDLAPPSPELDSWDGVSPGTDLEFSVNAQNRARPSNQPCVAQTSQTQQFLAYIDLLADGVTVVDTRRVIIIVPPAPPNNQN